MTSAYGAYGVPPRTSRCALCEAETAPDARYCLACGEPLDQSEAVRPALRSLAPMRIVEADATALSAPDERRTGLAALPRLAALAWRQPAVRSVVTTGASAVALSLAWRVAGAALSGGRARNALLAEDALVSELLGGASPGKRLSRLSRLSRRVGKRRRGDVVEEVVYVRRITRR